MGSPHPGPAPGPDDAGADADADDADADADDADGGADVLDAHDDRHADLRRELRRAHDDVRRVWGDDVRCVVPRHDDRCGARCGARRWHPDRVSAPGRTTRSLSFFANSVRSGRVPASIFEVAALVLRQVEAYFFSTILRKQRQVAAAKLGFAEYKCALA